MKEKAPCQAPEHVDNCSGFGTTKDHFTSQAIAKQLGWSRRQINHSSNIQLLSPQCHKEKDKTTPRRLQEVIFQQYGGFIGFGEHLIVDLRHPTEATRMPPK